MKAENIIGREPFGCSVWNVPWDSNWATVKPLMYIRVISVIWLCGVRVCVPALVCDTEAEWTEWFSRDDERGSGDWEKLSDLHAAFPDRLCLNPLDIQVNPFTKHWAVTGLRKNWLLMIATTLISIFSSEQDELQQYIHQMKNKYTIKCFFLAMCLKVPSLRNKRCKKMQSSNCIKKINNWMIQMIQVTIRKAPE